MFAAQSRAQTSTPPDSAEVARRLDDLARRIDDLELGPVAGAPESRHGFGPAASKVYGVGRGISIGGYGEMLYENRAAETETGVASNAQDQIDFLRQIVYIGYKFDDRLLFNSEIEFEHSSTEHHGSVSVEFAYVDAMLRPEINARAGLLLVPMGFINELHEPPVFLGARRPETEQHIVPSTWRAAGFGAFGEPTPGLSYRAYVIESLRAAADPGSGVDGFNASGLRGGRQNGSEAVFADIAGVVRADYSRSGVGVGGSVFYGNAGQNELGGADAATTI